MQQGKTKGSTLLVADNKAGCSTAAMQQARGVSLNQQSCKTKPYQTQVKRASPVPFASQPQSPGALC